VKWAYRKKKKVKLNQDSEQQLEKERVKELLIKKEDIKDKTPSGSNGRNSPANNSSSSKTDAEQRFEEAQRRRVWYISPPCCTLFTYSDFLACGTGGETSQKDA
jgi:hypothetical protein